MLISYIGVQNYLTSWGLLLFAKKTAQYWKLRTDRSWEVCAFVYGGGLEVCKGCNQTPYAQASPNLC